MTRTKQICMALVLLMMVFPFGFSTYVYGENSSVEAEALNETESDEDGEKPLLELSKEFISYLLQSDRGFIPVRFRSGIFPERNPVYISTPRTVNGVYAGQLVTDWDNDTLDYLNSIDYSQYGVTIISSATGAYNCHSYAWYSSNYYTNDLWIPDPSCYYLDHSYCCVSSPQIGDIVCYYDDMGTNSTSDDHLIHSAIIEAISSGPSNNSCGISDLLTVVSKWGG